MSVLGVGWLVTEEEVGGKDCGGVAVICSTSDSSARRQRERAMSSDEVPSVL